MHHGPAERPAMGFVALWLSYEVCRECRPLVYIHVCFSYLSFLLLRVGQSNESNLSSSIHMLRGLRFFYDH